MPSCSLRCVIYTIYIGGIRLFAYLTHIYLIIIIMQINMKALHIQNDCQVYSLDCLSKIKSILSIISYALDGDMSFKLARSACDECDNMCTLIIYHHQIGNMNR